MITGTLGGIIRDVLAREPSVLMRQEVYVAAAMGGALVFVAGAGFGHGVAQTSEKLAAFAFGAFGHISAHHCSHAIYRRVGHGWERERLR